MDGNIQLLGKDPEQSHHNQLVNFDPDLKWEFGRHHKMVFVS